MSEIPESLKFTTSHEWAYMDDEGFIVVGITDYAQTLLGDITYVELPDIGDVIDADEDCSLIESIKATTEVYCPVSGQVVEVNEDLFSDPGLVNRSPYGDGWFFKLNPDNAKDIEKLLTAKAYQRQVAEEAH
ncbi:MAG: glycine cleavage system protein GcvH [Gammaproteobacteria bacterium]